jgi:hypothetical protein
MLFRCCETFIVLEHIVIFSLSQLSREKKLFHTNCVVAETFSIILKAVVTNSLETYYYLSWDQGVLCMVREKSVSLCVFHIVYLMRDKGFV